MKNVFRNISETSQSINNKKKLATSNQFIQFSNKNRFTNVSDIFVEQEAF